MPMMDDLIDGMPKMKRIWENSQLAQGKEMMREIQEYVEWARMIKKELKNGKVTLDDRVMPAWEQNGPL